MLRIQQKLHGLRARCGVRVCGRRSDRGPARLRWNLPSCPACLGKRMLVLNNGVTGHACL